MSAVVTELKASTAQPDPLRQLYNAIGDLADRKAVDAIERAIKEPPENSRVFTVSPSMARYLLAKYNLNNRSKKPANIGVYAADMLQGRWALTGDTLKFSNAGRLRDGQNRLQACVKSDTAFRTHFVFGIADEHFSKMDQGRNRDGADLLTIEGIANAADVAPAVRWAEMIATDTVKQRVTYKAPEILALYKDKHSGVSQFIAQARRIRTVTQQPIGVVAAMLYHFNAVSPSDMADFATAWESGKWSGHYRALDSLQKRVRELDTLTTGRVHDVVRAALIIIAWNAFRKQGGRDKRAFSWERGHDFPEIR